MLWQRKENIFLTDGRYIEDAKSILTIDDEITVYEFNDFSKDEYENFFMFCENVGFEEDYITYSQYKNYMSKYKINNLQETEKVIDEMVAAITSRMSDIESAATSSGTSSDVVLGQIKELTQMSEQLKETVASFKV